MLKHMGKGKNIHGPDSTHSASLVVELTQAAECVCMQNKNKNRGQRGIAGFRTKSLLQVWQQGQPVGIGSMCDNGWSRFKMTHSLELIWTEEHKQIVKMKRINKNRGAWDSNTAPAGCEQAWLTSWTRLDPWYWVGLAVEEAAKISERLKVQNCTKTRIRSLGGLISGLPRRIAWSWPLSCCYVWCRKEAQLIMYDQKS